MPNAYSLFCLLLMGLTGCRLHSPSERTISLNNNFRQLDSILYSESQYVYYQMVRDSQDIRYTLRANYFLSKAKALLFEVNSVKSTIDSLEVENRVEDSKSVAVSNDGALLIGKKLFILRDSIVSIASQFPSIYDTHLENTVSAYGWPHRTNKYELLTDSIIDKWGIKNFRPDDDVEFSRLMLAKNRNELYQLELALMNACRQGYTHGSRHFTNKNAIAGLSAQKLRPGDTLEVYAALADVIVPENLEISIDGKALKIPYDGVATQKIKAPMQPGTYKVDVKIIFKDQDGRELWFDRELGYKVSN